MKDAVLPPTELQYSVFREMQAIAFLSVARQCCQLGYTRRCPRDHTGPTYLLMEVIPQPPPTHTLTYPRTHAEAAEPRTQCTEPRAAPSLSFMQIRYFIKYKFHKTAGKSIYGRTLSERPCYILPMFFIFFFVRALVGQTAERIFTKLSHVVDIRCYLRTY